MRYVFLSCISRAAHGLNQPKTVRKKRVQKFCDHGAVNPGCNFMRLYILAGLLILVFNGIALIAFRKD